MTQLTLFNTLSSPPRPAVAFVPVPPSRRENPETSRRAALSHAEKAESNRERVLAALRANPGVSSYTISETLYLGENNHVEVMRRMSDLSKLGSVTTRPGANGKPIEGNRGVAWWPVENFQGRRMERR